MNPVAYRLTPRESLNFLLVGEAVYYRDGKEPERLWRLNIYSSAQSRQVEAKKIKRQSSDVIFIEWDITMEQIIKQGKLIFPIASGKVLCSDKIDIWRQLIRKKGK